MRREGEGGRIPSPRAPSPALSSAKSHRSLIIPPSSPRQRDGGTSPVCRQDKRREPGPADRIPPAMRRVAGGDHVR